MSDLHEFSIGRLIIGRKVRIQCTKWNVDDLMDLVIELDNKYRIPEIEQLQAQLNEAETKNAELVEEVELLNRYKHFWAGKDDEK